jgi:Lon protease-like protein
MGKYKKGPLYMNIMSSINLPEAIIVLVVNSVIIVPKTKGIVPVFNIDQLKAIGDAIKDGTFIGIVQKSDDGQIYAIGTLTKILDINEIDIDSGSIKKKDDLKNFDHTAVLLTLGGISRFKIEQKEQFNGYLLAKVSYDNYVVDMVEHHDFSMDRHRLMGALKKYLKKLDVEHNLDELMKFSNEKLVHVLTMFCPLDSKEKQALLETPSIIEQYKMMTKLLEISSYGYGNSTMVH